MTMNRIMGTAGGSSVGFTLKARIMGLNARGLESPLALTNLREVKN